MLSEGKAGLRAELQRKAKTHLTNAPDSRNSTHVERKPMKTYKCTTTIAGMREPFVDWYEAATKEQAKEAYDGDTRIYLSAQARAESLVKIEEVA